MWKICAGTGSAERDFVIELADILHYMEKSCEENAVTPVTRKLHQMVDRVKHNEEVDVRYMKAIEYEDIQLTEEDSRKYYKAFSEVGK